MSTLRDCDLPGEPIRFWGCAFLAAGALALLISACSALPAKFPESSPRTDLIAIDVTRIRVKDQFKYSPSLTALVLPEGEYIPVKSDRSGTYYQSPRGILVVPVAGAPFLVAGGILRRGDPTVNYPFAVYGGPMAEPLHNMLGLHLDDKIECMPACQFK
jgi:hypothetical protein